MHGERRNWCRVLVGNVKEGDDLENLGIERKIILKWILKNEVGGHGLN
jgi:hypothetical protein